MNNTPAIPLDPPPAPAPGGAPKLTIIGWVGLIGLVAVQLWQNQTGVPAVSGEASLRVAAFEQQIDDAWEGHACPERTIDTILLAGNLTWRRQCPSSGHWVEVDCTLAGCKRHESEQ